MSTRFDARAVLGAKDTTKSKNVVTLKVLLAQKEGEHK